MCPCRPSTRGKPLREEYLSYLRSIVQQYDLTIHTYEPVARIDRIKGGFELLTTRNGRDQLYHARRVVLCTGGTDRPRRLNIPGEDLAHVDHYFRDPHKFFRKRLLIVGGKNSAVEAALRCYQAGALVSISYRRDKLDPTSIKYWLLPEINGLIAAGKITAYFNTIPVEITSGSVSLRHVPGAEVTTEPFDFVLLLVGYEADMTLLRGAEWSCRATARYPCSTSRRWSPTFPAFTSRAAPSVGRRTNTRFSWRTATCISRVSLPRCAANRPRFPRPFMRPES